MAAAVALSCDIIAMITRFSLSSVLLDSISSGGWIGRPFWGRTSRSSCSHSQNFLPSSQRCSRYDLMTLQLGEQASSCGFNGSVFLAFWGFVEMLDTQQLTGWLPCHSFQSRSFHPRPSFRDRYWSLRLAQNVSPSQPPPAYHMPHHYLVSVSVSFSIALP